MTFSYKPVWFQAVLRHADEHGRALVADVDGAFRSFYLSRQAAGLIAERAASALAAPDECSEADVRQIIGNGPFYRFSRLDYVSYGSDRAYYQIHPAIWKQLRGDGERARVEALCKRGIDGYFSRRVGA